MKLNVFYRKVKRKLLQYRKRISIIKNRLVLYLNGVEAYKNVSVIGKIYISNEGKIKIGSNVRINSAQYANPIGGNERMYVQMGGLNIGDNTGISNTAITAVEKIDINFDWGWMQDI